MMYDTESSDGTLLSEYRIFVNGSLKGKVSHTGASLDGLQPGLTYK